MDVKHSIFAEEYPGRQFGTGVFLCAEKSGAQATDGLGRAALAAAGGARAMRSGPCTTWWVPAAAMPGPLATPRRLLRGTRVLSERD
jgi:hypothetical protein